MKTARLGILTLVLAAISTFTAQAQYAPYALFSAGHYSGQGVGPGTSSAQSGGITSFGGTFGLNDDFIKAGPIKLGADARFMIQNSSNSTPYGNKLAGGLVGGRLSVNTIALPFRPYFGAEAGVVATNNGTSPSKSASFAYQFQFGSDFTLIPHLGLRLEYGAGQLTSGNPSHTLQTFGAGLVLRL